MSYGKGSARPDAMSLPEHLIPHGMLGQIGRSQRPPQELNNSQSYHETDSAPSHTEFVSSAADAAFDNSNKLSHSSLLLLYDRQQQQLPQGMVNQYPDTKSAGYNSRWAGPSTGKAPYPTSNNFSNPDSLNDAQHSQQIPYNGRYQPQYTAHQVNRPQYQGQRLMTSTLSNPYPAPYANSSAGQLPRQGLRGTLQSQNGSSLSLDTTGSIQNPPYGAGPPFGTVPEYGYAEHPTSMNSGVTGQHDMPPSQPGMFGFPSAQSFNSNPRKVPSSMEPMPEGRRIVSSPTVSTHPGVVAPLGSQAYSQQRNEARTKSLSSSSTKHNSAPTNYPPTQQNFQNQSSRTSNQTSSNSSHTFSLSSKSRSFSSLGKLSSLSTKKFSSSASLQNKQERNVSSSTIASQKTMAMFQPRKPSIYPAVLSRVAKAFKDSVILTINMKDGLEYHDSFTGDTAVDVICSIIRTNDRNLALLLGRSLDAQKFFHDVTYNHRLRDLSHEVYTFSRNYNDVEFFAEDGNGHGSNNNSNRGSFNEHQMSVLPQPPSSAPYPTSSAPPSIPPSPVDGGIAVFGQNHKPRELQESSGVNGVFTILSNCYSPTCTRDSLCYSIACPRRLEQQARLNMKPRGGLKRAVSRLSLHDNETNKTLWHETVDQLVLDDLDKHEKMRQELIYELIYTERDYVKDLEFMTDFYILPLRNPANNIIPEREREAFIRTVFGGVSELLRLGKSLSEALTNRQQQQKPVVESVGDVFLQFVGSFDPFIKYSGNKVFASFEHERQQQVNVKYARFLDAIEKKPESRKQDLSSFLIKGVQRPARYQLLLGGILKNTNESSPDYKNLVKAKEEIEKVLNKINIQTGESTDRHKIMVLHRLLGRQTLEDRFNFKLNYNNRIIYQVTLSRKRDNEKIDLYLFEHALLLVKHKIQNKREVHKVFEKPIYLPLLFVNSGYDSPGIKSILQFRENGSIVSDTSLRNRAEASNYNPVSSSQQKLQVNFLGLGNNPVHVSLYADDVTNQSQILLQVQQQQRKLLDKHDIFSLSKYETRRFTGHNRINCAVPCYGGKKLLYGTDAGVWVSTVRSISMTSNEKICSDPTMVISKPYISQMEVLVEYSKLLVLSEKTLYEFDLSCTDSLDHVKNTRSGKIILNYVSFFKTGVCDGRLLVCAVKSGSAKAISIVEPTNPFDPKMRGKGKKPEVREIAFMSEPVSISFLKTKLCIGCTKGFEILSLEAGRKEPILDEADPSLDFATQRESVAPLGIHRLGKSFLLSYSEFSFLINRNGWRTKHDWGIFWEGSPQNIALFYPYLLAFDPGFIEIRDLESTTLIRALIGENIRFLHSNEHEALYACEENGYDIIVSIDFLNLKPKQKS